MKHQQIIGATLRSKPFNVKKSLLPIIISDIYFNNSISKVFKWEHTLEALEYMKENKNMGKIVVEVNI